MTKRKETLSERQLLRLILKELRKTAEKKYLDADTASNYLGIKRSYLYKLTHQSEITFYKTGKKIYFRKIDLDRYISKNKVPSIYEIKRISDNNADL